MITITTKVGVLYIEAENEREESDRIKLYDSHSRYLEFLPLESVSEYETIAQYCNKVIRRLEECETVEDILNYLGVRFYKIGKTWIDIVDDLFGKDYYYDPETDKCIEVHGVEERTKQSVLDNEFVNIIGDMFVLNCE